MGIRWEEIDMSLILTHRLSNSVRGNTSVTDAEAGNIKAWDLKFRPRIMDEVRSPVGKDQRRLPTSLIVSRTAIAGQAWQWKLSRQVPKKKTMRRTRGHTRSETSGICCEDLERQCELAKFRMEKRKQ
jgi:hypothetical protein